MAKGWNLTRLFAQLFLLAMCAGLSGAPAVPEPKKDADSSEGITLATDRIVRQRLLTARDYVKAESWLEAVRLLQTILDAREDVFVSLPSRDREGSSWTRWASARDEAERLLSQMPPKGLEVYELHFGAAAARRLTEAGEKNDTLVLLDLSRRYFHTRAGREALLQLATHYLDRGRSGLAALAFHRLLQVADSVPPPHLPPFETPARP